MRLDSRFLVLPLVVVLSLSACSDDDTSEANASSQQRAALDTEISQLKDKVRQLEAATSTSDTAKQQVQAELDSTRAALQAAEAKLAAEDYEGAMADVAAVSKSLADLQVKVDAMPGSITLEAKFAFGSDSDFQLDKPYQLETGKTVTFNEVRYWLTNVKLQTVGGVPYAAPNAYYLVEIRNEQTLSNGTQATIKLPASRRESIVISGVPAGSYSGVEFSVGVDAAHNDNLALPGGELHVLTNMASSSWMWFTSYIFTKVGGSFTEGVAEPLTLSWETGANANLRSVTKTFAAPIRVGVGTTSSVALRADVKKLFTGLDAKATPSIKAAQENERTTLSDNWSGAFDLVSASGQ